MKEFTWGGDFGDILDSFLSCACGSNQTKAKSLRSGKYVCGACHLKEEVDAVKESK
jgi:hypothetical protein